MPHIGTKIARETWLEEVACHQKKHVVFLQQKKEDQKKMMRKIIANYLYQQYETKKKIMNIHQVFSHPSEAFNQELFKKLYPKLNLKLVDILNFSVDKLRESIHSDFKCLMEDFHQKAPNLKQGSKIIQN